jgi:hypothetical protein
MIRFPDTSRLCDGSLSSEPTWQRDVAATGDVMIMPRDSAAQYRPWDDLKGEGGAGRQREAQKGRNE